MTHLKYKRQYLHPETKEVLNNSQYLNVKKGVKQTGDIRYLVGGKWVSKDYVPEIRELEKKRKSCLRGFFRHIKDKMSQKNKDSLAKGRDLIGENEFKDEHGCYDKLQAHYDEQVKRYGPICPITHMEFTFKRNNEQTVTGNGLLNVTNLSGDRLLNEQNYTKQNTLFTSVGWNLARRNFSLKDMSLLMRKDFFDRYMEILSERFPDQKYKIEELKNGAEHPQEGR